jgi:hypothetical protein
LVINVRTQQIGFSAFELIDGKVEEAQKIFSLSLLRRLLELHRVLFPMLRRKIELIRTRRTKKRNTEPKGAEWKIPVLAHTFARNVELSSVLANSRRSQFVCLLQPVRSGAEGGHGKILEHYAEFRRQVKNRLEEKGVPCLDLNSPHCKILDQYFIDLTHLNAEGHRLLADVIARELRSEGLYQ